MLRKLLLTYLLDKPLITPALPQTPVEPPSHCSLPPSIAQILNDPAVSEDVKNEYRRGSALFQAYFSQALGGIYQSNLDGVPNYKRPRQSRATNAKFRAIVARDSKAIRNDINVRVEVYHSSMMTIKD